jgi:hypothetical protein
MDAVRGWTQLGRAIWALGKLNEASTAAEVARCINAKTSAHWSGPGAGKFFLQHFADSGASLYFEREVICGGKNGISYRYWLTPKAQDVYDEWAPRLLDDIEGRNSQVQEAMQKPSRRVSFEQRLQAVEQRLDTLGQQPRVFGMTEAEMGRALKNVGIDMECGACASVLITGVTTAQHTCKRIDTGVSRAPR